MTQPAIATKWSSGRRDHERVEELVEAEDARPRVGPLARVDDGAGRVEQPAGQEQGRRRRAGLAEDLGQRDHDHPADADVGQRDGQPRRVDPRDAERDAEQRAGPDADQDDRAARRLEHERGDRRVAGGDEDEDHGVVDAAQDRLPARGGRPAVVDGARDEEGVQADAVDRGRQRAACPAGAKRDEQRGGREREPDRVLMEPAAQRRGARRSSAPKITTPERVRGAGEGAPLKVPCCVSPGGETRPSLPKCCRT